MRSLAEEFPKKLRHLYSVASQQSALEDPLACAASVFALNHLHSQRLVDQVFVFENGAVQEMCSGAGRLLDCTMRHPSSINIAKLTFAVMAFPTFSCLTVPCSCIFHLWWPSNFASAIAHPPLAPNCWLAVEVNVEYLYRCWRAAAIVPELEHYDFTRYEQHHNPAATALHWLN